MKKIIFLLFSFTLIAIQNVLSTPSTGLKLLRDWKPASVVTEADVKVYSLDSCFQILPISDSVFSRMRGKSYKKECSIPLSDLRYLKLLHRNANGKPQLGEMVCNKIIASILLKIFRELYEAGYRIERMVLVDDYNAVDEKAMEANNTSAFNYRNVSGGRKLSKHSLGLAVDVNPLYNPCHRLSIGKIEPALGKKYVYNRSKRKDIPYKIDHNDLCYKLFRSYGFSWGGDWRSVKDYQHFEYIMK
jgi:hypothetical protein